MKKIVIITGSASKNSHTASLAETIKTSLEKNNNLTIKHFNLATFTLPLYSTDQEEELMKTDPNLKEFLELTAEADGFIRGSPVYHGCFSGALKNSLDRMHFFLTDRTIGLISNGANRGRQVVDALSLIAKNQHGVIVPTHICTHKTDYDEDLNLTAEDVHKRIEKFCDQYMWYLEKFERS